MILALDLEPKKKMKEKKYFKELRRLHGPALGRRRKGLKEGGDGAGQGRHDQGDYRFPKAVSQNARIDGVTVPNRDFRQTSRSGQVLAQIGRKSRTFSDSKQWRPTMRVPMVSLLAFAAFAFAASGSRGDSETPSGSPLPAPTSTEAPAASSQPMAAGWLKLNTTWNPKACGSPPSSSQNMQTVRRNS